MCGLVQVTVMVKIYNKMWGVKKFLYFSVIYIHSSKYLVCRERASSYLVVEHLQGKSKWNIQVILVVYQHEYVATLKLNSVHNGYTVHPDSFSS